jgi:hypothetical protein
MTSSQPYGAPLYGPVRYTVPGRKNGCGPDPAPASTVPTCDAAGHAAVADGVHTGTLPTLASSPGGKRRSQTEELLVGITPGERERERRARTRLRI